MEQQASTALQDCLHRLGCRVVAGVDEAGRGPLAGPVVAAAVTVRPGTGIAGVMDSKALSSRRREELFCSIVRRAAAWGVGVVTAAEIDATDILRATLTAMEKALVGMRLTPDLVVVDGITRLPLALPQYPLKKGDARSQVVAAASIIAKVVRDRLMCYYHCRYPAYGFDRHKGYGTKRHAAAIAAHGCSPIHRRSFRLRGVS
ncbi:MAG: ribonuclease HII [Deltaproteobacteria bacterium]|nr:ribonuclease HII [Candidatus Anaeroferrophillacea bacterium]